MGGALCAQFGRGDHVPGVAGPRLAGLVAVPVVPCVAATSPAPAVPPREEQPGDVLERTGISEQAVRYHTVALRDGRTIYGRIGEKPVVGAAIVVVVVGLLLAGWDRRRRLRGRDTGSDADGAEAGDTGSDTGDVADDIDRFDVDSTGPAAPELRRKRATHGAFSSHFAWSGEQAGLSAMR